MCIYSQFTRENVAHSATRCNQKFKSGVAQEKPWTSLSYSIDAG